MSYYATFAATPTASSGTPPLPGNGPERITRILVVGETKVGKTLLIRRLCDHIFGDTTIEEAADDGPAPSDSAQPLSRRHSAADEDELGPEWGPTVGLAVDALRRTTTTLLSDAAVAAPGGVSMPSLYSADGPGGTALTGLYPGEAGGYAAAPSLYGAAQAPFNSYGGMGGTGGGPYRRQVAEGGGGGSRSAVSANPFAPPPHQMNGAGAARPRRQTVSQTVEFHELGGTHGYRDIARLPLRQIQYDGVLFVYHRRNLTSTLYLKEWYQWLQAALAPSTGGVSVNGAGRAGKGGGTALPRFMLVGTQLPGDELPAAAAGLNKDVKETLHIASGAISDEALLDGNLELRLRTLQSPQTPVKDGRVRRVLWSVGHSLAWPCRVLWCLWHPFFFLSEQYREERGRRNRLITLCTRLVERGVWLLYQAEQALLYVIAVVLFGPYQEAVSLGHSRTKQTLEQLLKDEQCVAQAHVCRLDSDISLQSSLDELLAFFDVLLRDDAPEEKR